ncbi:CBS domain-containing protein [archaeon]|nr:MAG: CBS domain-containing protein [archaeon]
MPSRRRFLRDELEGLKEKLSTEHDGWQELRFPRKMQAREIMEEPHLIDDDATIKDLLYKMKLLNATNFIVVDDDEKVRGIVTESDFLKIVSRPSLPSGIGGAHSADLFFRASEVVRDIMTEDPITVREDDSLEEVTTTMRKFKISHVPVVDKTEKVLGIISTKDVLTVLRLLG